VIDRPDRPDRLGDPALDDGFPAGPEELSGDALAEAQDILEIDDRTTAGLFRVDAPAIEHWRRRGVPVAHAETFRRLREVASRLHSHHAGRPGTLLTVPLAASQGRTLLDLVRDPDADLGTALDQVLSLPDSEEPAPVRRRDPSRPVVADLMTRDPVVVDAADPLQEAARRMRGADVGDLVVIERGEPVGVLTDRDIVVRAVAESRDVRVTASGSIATRPLLAVSPDTPVHEALQRMRTSAVRRLAVLEEGRLVGVVGLGDIAVECDPDSPLAAVVIEPATD
jgi:CBS domain-containing protein